MSSQPDVSRPERTLDSKHVEETHIWVVGRGATAISNRYICPKCGLEFVGGPAVIRCHFLGSEKSGKNAKVARCPNASEEILRAMAKEEEAAERKRKAKQMSKDKRRGEVVGNAQDSASVASSTSSHPQGPPSIASSSHNASPSVSNISSAGKQAEQQSRSRPLLFTSPPSSASELARQIQSILRRSAQGELKLSKPLSDVGKTKELCERILTTVEWLHDVMDYREPIDPSVIQLLYEKKQTIDHTTNMEETCEETDGLDEWAQMMPVSKMLRTMIDNLNHDVDKTAKDDTNDTHKKLDLQDLLQHNQSSNFNIIQNCDEQCENAMADIVKSIQGDHDPSTSDALCDHEGGTREVKNVEELQTLEDELFEIICKQRQPSLKFCKTSTGGVHQYAAYVSPVLQSSAQQYHSNTLGQPGNKPMAIHRQVGR